jgi:hypothetical protein
MFQPKLFINDTIIQTNNKNLTHIASWNRYLYERTNAVNVQLIKYKYIRLIVGRKIIDSYTY